MVDYVKATNFFVKDSLLVGNPDKIVKGSEIDTEFNNIATAIASKANYASPNLTGIPTTPTASTGTNTSQIASTAFVKSSVDANNANVNITGGAISGISPPIPVASGGTGLNTLTAESVMIGNGTEDVKFVAPGASGNVLVSNGTIWESKAATGITATSGTAPYYGARAFVTFNGMGSIGGNMTLLSSGNVASVVKNAVGDYTVNFTTELPSANYAMSGASKNQTETSPTNTGAGGAVSFSSTTVPTTTSCRVWNVWLNESSGAINIVQPADADRISLVFFI